MNSLGRAPQPPGPSPINAKPRWNHLASQPPTKIEGGKTEEPHVIQVPTAVQPEALSVWCAQKPAPAQNTSCTTFPFSLQPSVLLHHFEQQQLLNHVIAVNQM